MPGMIGETAPPGYESPVANAPAGPFSAGADAITLQSIVPDLFSEHRQRLFKTVEPLPVRLRPRNLDEFIGQRHLLAPGSLLRRMLEADRLTSVIFWGPPGTGKTTLAEIIARSTGSHFERAVASDVGVAEVRRVIADAEKRLGTGGTKTIFFLDEIHRFARNQQDVLLASVERGIITLIGTTTENPYFAINAALNSRSTIFRFEVLTEEDIAEVIRRAARDERAFGHLQVTIDDDSVAHWARISDGDARRALNALEVAVLSQSRETASDVRGTQGDAQTVHIDLAAAEQSIQAKALTYDGTGDEHYDVVSAFIKSMRGDDPDAAVYWLARMLEAGEDPRFIARRIAILASEDVGNADPHAIQIAAAAWEITERVGMPECQLTLAQAAIYMATAPKSNASAMAIWNAMKDVRENRTVPVPKSLRDAHYGGAKALGHGENYVNPHDSADGHVPQEYLGIDRVFYSPTDRGYEMEIGRRLADWKKRSTLGTSSLAPAQDNERNDVTKQGGHSQGSAHNAQQDER
jgi:putative ATPase